MKTLLKHTFLLGSLGVMLASCETPFYIHTQVNPNLSLHRDIYTDSTFFKTSGDPDKALPRPVFCGQGRADTFCAEYPPQGFMIDFYGEPTHMMIRYRTDYNASFWPSNRILVDSTQMENPLLQPEENMQKHFRWFFTYYEYTATIKAFENLPVPLSSYLSPEEQAVFFGNSPLPQGWNGKESYEYLESINNKFVQWYNRSLFETNYDILYSLADAELRKNICLALSVPALYGEPSFTMEMDEPAEVKVTSEKTRAGFQKKVSVTVEISDYSQEVEEKIPEIEKKPHHLLMYRSDGRRVFVRCSPFAYLCSVDDTSDIKTIQFEITNTNGMQLVI